MSTKQCLASFSSGSLPDRAPPDEAPLLQQTMCKEVPAGSLLAGQQHLKEAVPRAAFDNMVPDVGSNSSHGLYEDDSEVLLQISQLQTSIEALQSLRSSQKVDEALSCLREQIEELQLRWHPKVRAEAFEEISGSSRSLETQLMMSKYSDDVYLTKFSKIQLSENVSRSSVLNQHPVVDDTFGLYSPALSLSIRGIGFLFKKFFDPNSKMTRESKETLYLVLRFFDACFFHLDLSVKSWSMPIETYYSLFPKPLGVRIQNINQLISEIPKDLIRLAQERFPSFPKPHDVEEKLPMFHWIVRLSYVFYDKFKKALIQISSPTEMCAPLDNFLHVGEILSVLAFDYLNVTSYTPCGDLDYLESLLFLIKQQYWIAEFHVFSHLLSMAVCYAQNLGIHRWEFYVGMDEELAERRRSLWWRCYAWDKLFAVQTGKQPLIEETYMNCLSTNSIRKAGFIDRQDFISSVLTLKEPPVMESIEQVMEYGFVGLAQLISEFFEKVLYNRKYTDFRNHAKPKICKESLLRELIKEVDLFAAKFDAVKIQSNSIFLLSSKVDQLCSLSAEEVDQVTQAAVFEVYFEFCTTVCLTSVDHLFARFKVVHFSKSVGDAIERYQKRIYKSWKTVLHILDQQHLYLRWQSIGPACIVFLTVISDYFAYFKENASDDLITILRVAKNLEYLELFGDESISRISRIRRQYSKSRTFFQILVRMSLQLYKRKTGITNEQLIELLKERDSTLIAFTTRSLNVESDIFEQCFKAKEMGSIHQQYRRSLEQEDVLEHKSEIPLEFNADKISASPVAPVPLSASVPFQEPPLNNITNVVENAFGNDSSIPMSPLTNFNLGSLDDFLNYGEDDLYNKLWGDIHTTTLPDFLQDVVNE